MRAFTLITVVVLCSAIPVCGGDPEFTRGDADGNGAVVALLDTLFMFNYLIGEESIDCLDAADTNDDGNVNVLDCVFLLHYAFANGEEPPAPFPGCGSDPTDDDLGCDDSDCE